MDYVININNLSKSYGNTQALKNITLQVPKGQIFGLLGPSGSGKTTMIKTLTGELKKTTGEIQVLSMAEEQLSTPNYKAKIGVLSDNSALYERLSIYDNLKLTCKLYDVSLNEIDTILEKVNLIDDKKKVVSKLSKGMKQRVMLARTLIHKPDLLFLDEPTSALDPGNVDKIHQILRELNEEGTTIFLSTHNMEEATNLCDCVGLLYKGIIQEMDHPDHLRYQHSTNQFEVETHDGELIKIENKPENSGQIEQLIASGRVKRMYTDDPTLGEVFLKVTGKDLGS
ncbi:ABC transporter ATP-binding protein [Alkalibacillus haloalkaliphilus]|uniref:Bacitracin ABC transporter ATP-binding protein n=1 Tax=Alkalibacillus haloalkaliphilus TaxID=94136 RepID=A0A511W7S5_9BACI|nr:ABC transporter ATP-binding protein [Alkalibacillus haloalkaliphilus]GEN45442.1 bacitracin ABC transporter ATP-binding protein [Alkalibacillus haloalkaliphilus]